MDVIDLQVVMQIRKNCKPAMGEGSSKLICDLEPWKGSGLKAPGTADISGIGHAENRCTV